MGLPVEERCDEHLIKRSYDKHGLIRSLQSSLGAQLSYERNEYGELICFKANEAETNARFTSEHQYDSLGFELERLLPGGVSQSFAYDNIGRLVNSKTRHYNWGSADWILSIEDDRYGLTQYSYSPSGELTVFTYVMPGRCPPVGTLTESLVYMLCVVSLIVLVGGIVEGL